MPVFILVSAIYTPHINNCELKNCPRRITPQGQYTISHANNYEL